MSTLTLDKDKKADLAGPGIVTDKRGQPKRLPLNEFSLANFQFTFTRSLLPGYKALLVNGASLIFP
jgi:hypothetical protein